MHQHATTHSKKMPINHNSCESDTMHASDHALDAQMSQSTEFPFPALMNAPRPSTPDNKQRAEFLARYNLDADKLVEIRNHLEFLARIAGAMIIGADLSVAASNSKKNTSDRVTETDHAVEQMIHDNLTLKYPDFGFLGEETFKHGDKLADKPTFVCDPIDGTLNFIHGFPNSAVSLALTIEKKPFVGIVFNPHRGDLFSAIKWQGAFLTTDTEQILRLPISLAPGPLQSLNDCLVAIEWGSQRDGPNWDLRTSMAQKLMTSKAAGGAMVHSLRSSGSASLDFCYVAAGWIDVFWEGGCWIWDVCAGWIILEEAGGIVASANPGDWEPTLEGRLYLAVRSAKRQEQEAVVKELWGMMGDRRFHYPATTSQAGGSKNAQP